MGTDRCEAVRGRSTRRDAALARPSSACIAFWALAFSVTFTGAAHAEDSSPDSTAKSGAMTTHVKTRTKGPRQHPARRPGPAAKEPAAQVYKVQDSVPLPEHTRRDTGRVAETRRLHGDSEIAAANATQPAHERAVSPVHPATALEPPPAADATQPPPFQDPRDFSEERPVLPPSAERPAPALAAPVDAGPAPSADSAPPSAASSAIEPPQPIDRLPEEPATPDNAPQTRAVEPSGALDSSRPASAPSASPAEIVTSGGTSEPRTGDPQTGTSEGQVTLDTTVLDRIRLEIKTRLFYFQACADAARRRGGLEIRRLQATWLVNADGSIKELKIDGVPDVQLAACLAHAGGRPFSIRPGTDLTIPTPIIFIR